jgi:hypothetical protein
MNIQMILKSIVLMTVLAMIGGAFLLGTRYGESRKDSQALRDLDAAFERLFNAEEELDTLRKERKEITRGQVRIIRQTADSCADAVPAPDILRVLDESDAAGKP